MIYIIKYTIPIPRQNIIFLGIHKGSIYFPKFEVMPPNFIRPFSLLVQKIRSADSERLFLRRFVMKVRIERSSSPHKEV